MSFFSLIKNISDPRNAFERPERMISTGVKITKDAGKLAFDSTKRAITNPTGIVDNVIADVNQAASVTAKAITKPVTDEIKNVAKDVYSSEDFLSDQRRAAEKQRFAAANAAAAAKASAAAAAEKQRLASANASAAAKASAAAAAEAIAKSASEASKSAGETAKQSAAYNAAQAKKQLYKEAAEATTKSESEASKSAGFASASKAVEDASEIENADSQGTQQIRDSAAMAQNSAATSEQMQYLPEVQVKSDFSKYLLIGGGVLLLAYILKGDEK